MAHSSFATGDISGRADPDLADAVAPYLRPLEELRRMSGVAVRKDVRVKTLLRVEAPPPLGPLLVKVFKCERAWDRLRYAFRPSKAALELDRALALLARGVPTLPPAAVFDRRGPLRALEESAIVIRERGDLRDLGVAIERAAAAGDRAARAALVEAHGRLLRTAHDAGVFQEDVGLNNVLVEDGEPGASPRLFVIDLERVHLRAGPLPEGLRARNLATLVWTTEDLATPRDWLRFLGAYAAGDRALARRLRAATRVAYGRYLRRAWRRARKNSLTENRFIALVRADGGGGGDGGGAGSGRGGGGAGGEGGRGEVRGYLRRRYAEGEPERFTREGVRPLLESLARGEVPAAPTVAPAGGGAPLPVRVERFASRPFPLPPPGLDRWVLLNRLVRLRRASEAEALPVAYVARRVGALSREGFLVTLAEVGS